MSPEVSVLLPVHDAQQTLLAAVQSVQRQTLQSWELVAVDDGSTDDSLELLRALAAEDRRIRVTPQPYGGIVAALNRAATLARAPLLARMDADDLSTPDRLQRQVSWLRRRPRLAAVGSLVQSISSGELTDGWLRYERWLNSRRTAQQIARDLFVESPLAHPSVTLRRSALEAVGGYRELAMPEDYDLWLRLHLGGWQLAKVPAVLLQWRDHPRRLTRVDPRYSEAAFLRLKAHHLARGPLADRSAGVWIWGAGRYGKKLGRALQREQIEVQAFVDIDPRKIGRTRRQRPVVAPDALRGQSGIRVLAAVPVPGARTLIRRRLTSYGFREGRDYFCCA